LYLTEAIPPGMFPGKDRLVRAISRLRTDDDTFDQAVYDTFDGTGSPPGNPRVSHSLAQVKSDLAKVNGSAPRATNELG
jgi:hypothetical protein